MTSSAVSKCINRNCGRSILTTPFLSLDTTVSAIHDLIENHSRFQLSHFWTYLFFTSACRRDDSVTQWSRLMSVSWNRSLDHEALINVFLNDQWCGDVDRNSYISTWYYKWQNEIWKMMWNWLLKLRNHHTFRVIMRHGNVITLFYSWLSSNFNIFFHDLTWKRRLKSSWNLNHYFMTLKLDEVP